jgi:hypothetical protein
LIVGGHAVAYHGHPRFTGDIDFLLRPSTENANRVIAALGDFGFGALALKAADLTVPGQVVQLGRPPNRAESRRIAPNRIDLLTSISGVAFDEAWSSPIPAILGGEAVHFLGWDALLRNKEASGRDKDSVDLKKLLAIAERKRSQ